MYLCGMAIDLPLSTIFLLNFGNVPTVCFCVWGFFFFACLFFIVIFFYYAPVLDHIVDILLKLMVASGYVITGRKSFEILIQF